MLTKVTSGTSSGRVETRRGAATLPILNISPVTSVDSGPVASGSFHGAAGADRGAGAIAPPVEKKSVISSRVQAVSASGGAVRPDARSPRRMRSFSSARGSSGGGFRVFLEDAASAAVAESSASIVVSSASSWRRKRSVSSAMCLARSRTWVSPIQPPPMPAGTDLDNFFAASRTTGVVFLTERAKREDPRARIALGEHAEHDGVRLELPERAAPRFNEVPLRRRRGSRVLVVAS